MAKSVKKAAPKAAKKAAKAAAKAPAKAAKKAAPKKAVKAAPKKAAPKKAAPKKAAPKKAAPKKAAPKKAGAGLSTPLETSPQLSAIVGNKPLPRTQIIKKIWDYIKANKLQDKVNKRLINADAKLGELFGGKSQVSMFDLAKIVSSHVK
jgi:chromatin remodeling complex protein RSC6